MAPNRISSRRGTSDQKNSAKLMYSIAKRASFILCILLILSYLYGLQIVIASSKETKISTSGMRGGRVGDDARINIETDSNMHQKAEPQSEAVIAYAITLTGCPDDPKAHLGDGAAVLEHSIHLNSIQNPQSNSKYDYQMYALVHPNAKSCSHIYQQLNYKVIIADDPVPLQDIQGEYLRKNVPENGCCGEKEFVKLHAYRLVEHPVVVHIDLDVLILQPLDDLFDVMLMDEEEGADVRRNLPVMFQKPIPSRVDAFFTRDYNMVHPEMKQKGIQGGFLVLRPSMDTYNDFVDIIRTGHFTRYGGWGDLGFGGFYGAMTFQGIIPYYYDALKPNTAVELNRCIYNQMSDNPRTGRTVNDVVSGQCRTGEEECEDCRSRPIEEVKSVHFTLCNKPWQCLPHAANQIQHRLCQKMGREWYRIRRDLEVNRWNREEGKEKFRKETFFGYCTTTGAKGYIPMELPSLVDAE